MIAPVTVLCRRRNVAEERIRSPRGPASAMTSRSAVVFITTEVVPSATNCRKTCPPPRFTNCGMKERKNNAVLGLKTSVATPCHNGFRAGFALAVSSAISSGVFSFSRRASRIVRTPRKHRYAAPTYFTVANAKADFARIIDTPSAAANTCTIPPRNVPSADSTPSRLPPARLRASTYSIPGPGAIASNNAAVRNRNSRAESGIMQQILLQQAIPQPSFQLGQGFHARLLAVSIGSRHIEEYGLHAGTCRSHVIHGVHITHVEAFLRPGIQAFEGCVKNFRTRLLESHDA